MDMGTSGVGLSIGCLLESYSLLIFWTLYYPNLHAHILYNLIALEYLIGFALISTEMPHNQNKK